MSKETTTVKLTTEIKKIHKDFDRLYLHNKSRKSITLTKVQYEMYCAAITDREYKAGDGVYWHGIEIKKTGKA